MSNKSRILIYIQFSSFVFFAIAGSLFTRDFWLILQIIGLGLGAWGVLAMRMGNFNIQPEVKTNAVMVSRGPYKIIRNPMYAGLLLFFGVSVFMNFDFNNLLYSYIRLSIFILLTTVLIMKIYMEETFLTNKFGEGYTEFKEKTYRLIPFVY